MSLASVFAISDAIYKAQVMEATWGHLEACPGEQHSGRFTFIYGQHGNMCVIESDFQTFGEGPGYYEDREDYIWNLVKDKGPCSSLGVYQFDGVYKRYKNGNTRFIGKITKIHSGFEKIT